MRGLGGLERWTPVHPPQLQRRGNTSRIVIVITGDSTWTFGHPDGDRPVLAAEMLGTRRVHKRSTLCARWSIGTGTPTWQRRRCEARSTSPEPESFAIGSRSSYPGARSWSAKRPGERSPERPVPPPSHAPSWRSRTIASCD